MIGLILNKQTWWLFGNFLKILFQNKLLEFYLRLHPMLYPHTLV